MACRFKRMSVTITSLTRTKPIRIYDVSAGGCLLESREPLPIGTVGLLTMNFDGRLRQEWIRVCRVQADESRRGPCLVSVEFLPLEPAGAESLRGAVLRMHQTGDLKAPAPVEEEDEAPIVPAKKGPSVTTIVLFLLAIAAAVYWFYLRRK